MYVDDVSYVDYYSPYIETHEKVNNAYVLACSKEVSRNLTENITNAIEKIGRCKIGGENDNVIASYNEVVNSYLNRLNNLYAFSASYSVFEIAYCDLCFELDELKEYDRKFKKKFQQQPSESDSKYAITNEDGTTGTNVSQYRMDLRNWELKFQIIKNVVKHYQIISKII